MSCTCLCALQPVWLHHLLLLTSLRMWKQVTHGPCCSEPFCPGSTLDQRWAGPCILCSEGIQAEHVFSKEGFLKLVKIKDFKSILTMISTTMKKIMRAREMIQKAVWLLELLRLARGSWVQQLMKKMMILTSMGLPYRAVFLLQLVPHALCLVVCCSPAILAGNAR